MASINLDGLAQAIATYAKVEKKLVLAEFAKAMKVSVDKYCKIVTKVNGEYHLYNTVMSHVVQGFEPKWQELGEWYARESIIKSYRQKVNFPIVPANVLGTALAELYQENKEPTVKEIVRVIIKDLLIQITDDLELLSMQGSYDPANKSGKFGFSLEGWNQIVKDLIKNTNNPAYKIPLDPLTEVNIYDQLLKFEKDIPKKMRAKIKYIHMSTNNADNYTIEYESRKGQVVTYKDSDKTKSPLGKRAIIGHDNMDDDIIFATIEGNMVKLIDLIENPATINDVQKEDYKIKLFSDFELGYGFALNEAVLVANFTDKTKGLGDEKLMELYYPHESGIKKNNV